MTLEARRGDTVEIDISALRQGSTPATFESGDELAFTVRATPGGSVLVAVTSGADGGITYDVDETTGLITIDPEDWRVAHLAARVTGTCDLQLTRADGRVVTLAYEPFIVKPDITL